ncbi:MAG: ferrous iron transport protein B [Thermosphaera sp.]
MAEIRVALVGQPNVGKSTLFKALTGGETRIANWPGTSVERIEGLVKHKGWDIRIVDLPGIYGFSATTFEEKLSRDYILSGEPNVVVVLVDALIPERTLYLAVETLELAGNVIIAFTKTDLAHSHGVHINYGLIQSRLKAPVVPTSAVCEQGLKDLLDKIIETASSKTPPSGTLKLDYGELEPFIDSILKTLARHKGLTNYPLRWLALRLLEGDPELEQRIAGEAGEEVLREIREVRSEASRMLGRDLAALIASKRFHFILELTSAAIVKRRVEERASRYKFFYNPIAGPFVTISIILAMFLAVFALNTGFPLNALLEALGYEEAAVIVEEYSVSGLLDKALSTLQGIIESSIENPFAASFIAEGVVGGVGAILVFIPLILVVSAVLASLEDSGLLPRMAIGAHYLTSKIGLSGASIFPLTLSLGCNVPAILATRASISFREKLRLTLTLPFIPCQARLIVLLAMSTALTSFSSSLLIITGYLASFLVFVAVNYALYRLQDKPRGRSPEILLEIPPLHKPIPKVVWWMTWSDLKHFIKRAGVIIFSASVIIWLLTHTTPGLQPTLDPSSSIAAAVSKLLAPSLRPMGITGEAAWIVLFGLLVGFFAKELFISSLLVISGAATIKQAALAAGLTDAELVPLTVFIVLYVPCLATLSAIYSETRSLRLTALSIATMLTVAYAASIATRLVLVLLQLV